jgi:hypothetical protein
MRHYVRGWFGWWLAGISFGVAVQAAGPGDGNNPNVVVLRGEKMITAEKPRATLSDIAMEMAKQTGYTFTVDPALSKSQREYAVLVRSVPLSGVLSATAYVSHGVWDKKGRSYLLRTPTKAEAANDAERYIAVVDKMAQYLKDVDISPQGIPENTPLGQAVSGFRFWANQQSTFSMFPNDSMNDWQVSTGPHNLGITYQAETETSDGQSRSMGSASWGWK